jgi:hypothetical protein
VNSVPELEVIPEEAEIEELDNGEEETDDEDTLEPVRANLF